MADPRPVSALGCCGDDDGSLPLLFLYGVDDDDDDGDCFIKGSVGSSDDEDELPNSMS